MTNLKEEYTNEEIENARDERKWKRISSNLNDKTFESEIQGNKEFLKNYKKYGKKLKSRWDENGNLEFTPFNMKEEKEEGNFDDDGFFLKKKHNQEEYDPWFESVKEDMKKKEYQECLKKNQAKSRNEGLNDMENESESESSIISKNEAGNNKSEDNINEKFFKGVERLTKKKKKFLMNEPESDDENENVGEFFKTKPETSAEKLEKKSLIKLNRVKLLNYLIDNHTVGFCLQKLKDKKKPEIKNKIRNKSTNSKKKDSFDDIVIEKINDPVKNIESEEVKEKEKVVIKKNIELTEDDIKFNELMETVSKLTELQHYNVYSDTREIIEKEYPYIKYEYFYKTQYFTDETQSQEFGPFTWENIVNWITNKYLEDTNEYKILFKFKNGDSTSNFFDKSDINFKIYLT